MKNIKIQFTAQEWLNIINILPLKKEDPITYQSVEWQQKSIILNTEKDIMLEFLKAMKLEMSNWKEANKDSNAIKPEILHIIPDFKYLNKKILNVIEKSEKHYEILLKNNQFINWKTLFWNMSNDHHKNKSIFINLNYSKNEEDFFNIFKNCLQLISLVNLNSFMEDIYQRWLDINLLDSKLEIEENLKQLHYDIHKSLRQIDPYDNPYVENIMHTLMNMSDIPWRAFTTAFNHIKEEKYGKND